MVFVLNIEAQVLPLDLRIPSRYSILTLRTARHNYFKLSVRYPGDSRKDARRADEFRISRQLGMQPVRCSTPLADGVSSDPCAK